MKTKKLGYLLLPAMLAAGNAHAQVTYTKANNNTALATAGSFVETGTIALTDTLLFNSTGVPTSAGLTVAAPNGSLGGLLRFTDIAGPVNITMSGTNTWTLGPNSPSFSGGIDMSVATADVTIGSAGRTFRWGGNNTGGISVAAGRTLTFGGNVTNAANTKTIVMTGPGNIVFNGAAGAGGAMGFSITGGATVTMNGTGGWTGVSAKEVINGTLLLGNNTALGSATLGLGGTNANTPTLAASGGARTIANGVTLLATSLGGNPTIAGSNDLTINGVLTNSGASRTLTVNNTGTTTFGTGGIALSESATNRVLTINGSGNVTVSGVIANGSTSTTSGLTYSGSGILSLGNANTFAGTLTASSGTTRIDHANAAQNATVSVGAANTLAFGTGITSATFAGLSGAGALALTNTDSNAVTLSVGNGNATSAYSGSLSGLGNITKIGTGTLTLTGNSSGYTGGILVSAGTLSVGSINGAGNSTSVITVSNGATINANSALASNNIAAGITLSGANANATFTSNQASGGFGGAISGSSDQTLIVSQAGGQTVNLNATNKQLQNFNGTVSVAVGQTLGFRATSLSNGGDNALFDINGSILPRNGGALALGALSGSGTLGMGTAGGNNTGLYYTIGAKNIDSTFSGVIQDGDASTGKLVNVIKTGSGTLTLSGNNTYTGLTTVNSGTLALGHATNTLADSAPVTVSGGTLAIGVNSDTVGVVTLTSGNITGSTGVLTGSTYNVESGTISAILGGAASLTKSTGGTVTLSGNNTYSGNTTVNGGILQVDGALGATAVTLNSGTLKVGASGSISSATISINGGSFDATALVGGYTVGSGQTISGTGTYDGKVTVGSGATLAPGNSPGVTTFSGDLTLAGTTVMEIDGTTRGTQYDGVNLTGSALNNLVYGGALTLSFGAAITAGTYDLFDLGLVSQSGDFTSVGATVNPVVSSFGGISITPGTGWTASLTDTSAALWNLSFDNASGDLTISAIPEPSSFAVLAGLAGLSLATLRRRSASALRNRSAA